MASSPPILINTIQATVLSATSNVLAQVITAVRNGTVVAIHKILTAQTAIRLNYTPILNFTIFTILNTPPNVVWQDFLESSFPTETLQPVVKHLTHSARAKDSAREVKAARSEWVETVRMEKKLDLKNTACKFVLDQTLGCFVNTVIFLAAMAALEGKDRAGVIQTVQQQTWPLMLASYKLWPLVSIFQFTVVPAHMRIVVGCIFGVGWGIFLSLFTAG